MWTKKQYFPDFVMKRCEETAELVPLGYHRVLSAYYKINETEETWDVARDACRSDVANGNLFMFESKYFARTLQMFTSKRNLLDPIILIPFLGDP